MKYIMPTETAATGRISLFPDQLQREPDVSRVYIDSFDGKSIYTAAQNQNSCFYEEGIRRFYGSKTKEMITDALSKFSVVK